MWMLLQAQRLASPKSGMGLRSHRKAAHLATWNTNIRQFQSVRYIGLDRQIFRQQRTPVAGKPHAHGQSLVKARHYFGGAQIHSQAILTEWPWKTNLSHGCSLCLHLIQMLWWWLIKIQSHAKALPKTFVPSQQIHAAKMHNDDKKCSRSVLRLLTPSQLCASDQVTCLPCASDASSGKGASLTQD